MKPVKPSAAACVCSTQTLAIDSQTSRGPLPSSSSPPPSSCHQPRDCNELIFFSPSFALPRLPSSLPPHLVPSHASPQTLSCFDFPPHFSLYHFARFALTLHLFITVAHLSLSVSVSLPPPFVLIFFIISLSFCDHTLSAERFNNSPSHLL